MKCQPGDRLALSLRRVQLFETGQRGSEVDVIGQAIQHQCRHGLNACLFRLWDPVLMLTKMHDLKIVTDGVEGRSHVLLCSDTDGTACMEEDRF